VIDAEAMEASAERLLRGAESLERSVDGTVKLSAPPGLVDAFVVPILPALRKAHPNLVLELFLVSHRVLRQVPRVDAVWRFLDAHFTSASEPARLKG